MSDGTMYLLRLRLYVVIQRLELLYVGPGKSGETIIVYPRDLTLSEVLRWWLMDWWTDKGENQLFQEMTLRFWTKHKSMFQPTNRKRLPARPLWGGPKYKQTVGPMSDAHARDGGEEAQ